MRQISPMGGPFALTGTSGSVTVGVGGEVSRVYGVYLVYGAGAPATSVFAFSNMGRTFFTSAAGNTNTYYPILEAAYGSNGVVLSTGNPYVEAAVQGTVTVNISAATASAGWYFALLLIDGGS